MIEMRNVLSTKLNKKGFTLAELLVVVAILAILVAVSIPIFTGKLNEAKKTTDEANMRAAKAAAVTEYLQDDANDTATEKIYYYNAKDGNVTSDGNVAKEIAGYSQSSANGGKDAKIVKITVTANGKKVDTAWVAKGTLN